MTVKNNNKNDYSRRDFLKTSAATIGAAGALSLAKLPSVQASEKSKGVPLSLAGYKFDRTKALAEGKVEIDNCDTQFKIAGIGDLNTDVFSGPQTYDVTEVGLHPFMWPGPMMDSGIMSCSPSFL